MQEYQEFTTFQMQNAPKTIYIVILRRDQLREPDAHSHVQGIIQKTKKGCRKLIFNRLLCLKFEPIVTIDWSPPPKSQQYSLPRQKSKAQIESFLAQTLMWDTAQHVLRVCSTKHVKKKRGVWHQAYSNSNSPKLDHS